MLSGWGEGSGGESLLEICMWIDGRLAGRRSALCEKRRREYTRDI